MIEVTEPFQQDPQTWFALLRQLVEHHVPALESSARLMLPAAGALVAGLILTFKGVAVVRMLLAAAGGLAGAFIGQIAAGWLTTNPPLTVALCAVLGAIIVSFMHRFWLALINMTVVLALVLAYQVGHADVATILTPTQSVAPATPQLLDPQQQQQLLDGDWKAELRAVGDRARARVERMTTRDAALPAIAALVAFLLGLKAPRLCVGSWIGGLGAVLVAGGALTILFAQRPEMRPNVMDHPEWVFGSAGALWALGVLSQCRRGARGRRRAAAAPPVVVAPSR